MDKVATPQDLQAELRRLLAYCQGEHPSRQRVASELRELADRVAKDLTVQEAEKLGKEAFKRALKGERSVAPAQDKNLISRLPKGPMGTAMPFLDAWLKGYHAAQREHAKKTLRALR